jgi:hypothetical protein
MGAIAIADLTLAPGSTLRIEGAAEMVKSGVTGAATARPTAIVCFRLPEDAVIVPT